jgi:hypothetical protein
VKLLLDENLSPCLVNRGSLAGIIYAPDFQNNFYGVNSLTVPRRSFGKTGIPAIPFIPGSLNADGTINFYDQAIFAAGGKLYTTLDAFVFDLGSFPVVSIAVGPAPYEIDPSTGFATLVGALEPLT